MERRPSRLRFIPHALSLARVLLVPAIYYAAWRRDEPLFAILVLLSILTDIMDGPLARHFRTADGFGANMDSAADLMFYISLPFWTYLFQPEIVLRQIPVLVAIASLYLVANVLSHRVFGALGVHNRLSRTSGTVGVMVAFYTILWGINPLLYVGLVAILSADLAQRYGNLLRATRMRRPAQGA